MTDTVGIESLRDRKDGLISKGWKRVGDGWVKSNSFMKPVPFETAQKLEKIISDWNDSLPSNDSQALKGDG
jgi:hypothetical protein